MTLICPVSGYKIDKNVTKLNGLLTLIALFIYISTNNIWIAALVTFDYLIRAFFKKGLSPLGFISKIILKVLKIKPNLIDSGPKIFACRIGFSMLLLIILFYFIFFHYIQSLWSSLRSWSFLQYWIFISVFVLDVNFIHFYIESNTKHKHCRNDT